MISKILSCVNKGMFGCLVEFFYDFRESNKLWSSSCNREDFFHDYYL